MTHKERDEDRRIHHDQAQDGRPTVSNPAGNGTRQKHADKGTALTRLEKGTLPSGWDCPAVRSGLNSKVFLKCLKRDEIGVQKHIERFHDLLLRDNMSDQVPVIQVPTTLARKVDRRRV